jgi:hypothetical protein
MRAHKIDANQADIKAVFLRLGWSVFDTSGVAGGFPDLLCALRGHTVAVEIKSAKGELTPPQVRFHREWQGEIATVRTIDDVLALITQVKARLRRRADPAQSG